MLIRQLFIQCNIRECLFTPEVRVGYEIANTELTEGRNMVRLTIFELDCKA